MRRKAINKSSWFYTSLLYLCGFFLFLEWLYPVKEITETNNLTVFIIYAIFCFCISMLQMNWVLSFLLKGSGLFVMIHQLFFNQSILSTSWVNQLVLELTFNIQSLFRQQWYEVTTIFRSVLFLLLIWLLSYLIHYWFVVTKRILLFILLTFIYLTVLNTFTDYDAGLAVVRTFMIAFIALGMANIFREMDREALRFPSGKKATMWMAPLLAVVLLSALIGYASPIIQPQWPDPVPFLKNTAENVQNTDIGSTIRKVGYGENDSQLGGSFVQDYTTVFRATAMEEHYWRIETKDEYTGKGWKNAAKPDYQVQQDGLISLETFTDHVETEQLEATLDFQGNTIIEKLIYPYGINQVDTVENVQLLLDDNSGEIRTQLHHKDASLENYTMTYDHPSFDTEALRGASEKDPANVFEVYTQLPNSLPSRVDELAEEITADYDNRYDKARAIEQYFGRNGFVYQISNVPVPEEEQDYVDQFLFDSKAGYCDNYSTSMVVMLRTLDIPARWAKGFTSGEKTTQQENGMNVYEVTNANAHSWVEVYFTGIGWVPFEPTQGFSNLSDFHVTEDAESEGEQGEGQEEDSTEEETTKPQQAEQDDKETETSEENAQAETEKQSVPWRYLSIGLFIIVLLFIVVYVTRIRWLTAFFATKLKRKPHAKNYQNAYHHLLKVLQYKGMVKSSDQTLREYAAQVDLRYGTSEMGKLTHYYERMLYNNEIDIAKTEELTKLWQDLIKRIMG